MTTPMLTKKGKKELGLNDLAGEIRRSIREIDSNYIRTLQGDVPKVFKSLNERYQQFIKGIHDCYVFSSWASFPFYETDFGWGNPTWVCTTSVRIKNGVVLLSSKGGDGIEAWVNLAEQHMAAFEQDPDVMKFVSMG